MTQHTETNPMTGLTWHQPQPGGHTIAMAGDMPVGAVWPSGEWRLLNFDTMPAPTAEAARASLETAWADWMAQAGLTWANK